MYFRLIFWPSPLSEKKLGQPSYTRLPAAHRNHDSLPVVYIQVCLRIPLVPTSLQILRPSPVRGVALTMAGQVRLHPTPHCVLRMGTRSPVGLHPLSLDMSDLRGDCLVI